MLSIGLGYKWSVDLASEESVTNRAILSLVDYLQRKYINNIGVN